MQTVIRAIDGLALGMARAGQFVIFALILSMLYEVIARYMFSAPTLWAFDISYMLNGAIFLLGAAFALKTDAHVRIDFLSQRFPRRFQQLFNGIMYLLILAPIFGALAYVATGKAWRAFTTGEVESVSPWAPLVWPFYGVIALGLLALALQFVSEALKYLQGTRTPEGAEAHAEETP